MANVDPAEELLRGLVNDPPMDDPPGNYLPTGRDGMPPKVELFSGGGFAPSVKMDDKL